jgi:hypothetical protein
MGLLDALYDEQFRKDVRANLGNLGQSMSNTIAQTVAGPVDLISWGMNKAGMPVQNPVGG